MVEIDVGRGTVGWLCDLVRYNGYQFGTERSSMMRSIKTLLPVLLIILCFTAVAQDAKAPLLPPPETLLLVEQESVCRHYSLNSAKPKYPEQAQKTGIQ